MVKVAVVQSPPILLDREATTAAMVAAIGEAAAAGAGLVVFPEAYLPGYPTWVWRLRPGEDIALSSEIHARLRRNAVDVGRGDLDPLRDAARTHNVIVSSGFHELDAEFSGTTLFNANVLIGPDAAILNRRRKLIPTNPERMVWGRGDASALSVVDTPLGRIGVLICWENYMPLARYALYGQNLEVLIAPTWDCGDVWVASMQHIAREGGCWVISGATALQARDLPADFPERSRLFPDPEEWICDGDAVIVQPSGKVLAGPLRREKGVLTGSIDPEAARRARRSLDVTGHYSRPDIFRLTVDRRAMKPVAFED